MIKISKISFFLSFFLRKLLFVNFFFTETSQLDHSPESGKNWENNIQRQKGRYTYLELGPEKALLHFPPPSIRLFNKSQAGEGENSIYFHLSTFYSFHRHIFICLQIHNIYIQLQFSFNIILADNSINISLRQRISQSDLFYRLLTYKPPL